MKSSESIKAIAPAFLKAQKEMEAVTKNSKNPFFKSDYADLNAVMEACKEPLNNNGISVLQPVNSNYVETVLMHESGEWLASETALIVKETNNPQALGSAISYARRYGLMSILGLPAEDDDGEKAMVREKSTAKPTVTQAVQMPKEENGKDTAIKVLYGVLKSKGLDPKMYVPKLAALKGHGSIGACDTNTVMQLAKDLRDMDVEEIDQLFNLPDSSYDLDKVIAEFDN